MPVSKHHRKGRPHSQWLRRRNILKVQAKEAVKAEMRRSMAKMMQQQMIAEAEQQAEKEEKNESNS